MNFIELKNISKKYFTKNESIGVIKNLNISISYGEFVVIFGPNGCGKTTLLNHLLGIISPDKGEIFFNGNELYNKGIGYVSQNSDDMLLPWRTALKNISLGLGSSRKTSQEREREIEDFLHKFHLQFPLDKYPYQLSGGQRQLICILRALIAGQKLLLLDEPFNNLDYILSAKIKSTISKIWQEKKITIILVTHNLREAILLGSRLIVFKERPIEEYLDIKINKEKNKINFSSNDEYLKIFKKACEFIER